MIVVCDTSPLNYLVLVGSVEVLPKLFQEVHVPRGVLQEMLHPRAPEEVRRWAASPPVWLKVAAVSAAAEAAAGLGPGELQAIALAKKLRSDWLLIDDRDGTRYAREQGLRVVGTLAVLELAAQRGLVNLPAVLDSLAGTTFRASPELIQAALERDAARRKGPA